MSNLPTLLKPGAVLPQKWMSSLQRASLNKIKSIEFLIDYLVDRAWDKDTPPKIKISGPGSRVLVLRSGTGTGKSTVIPANIYTKFFEERGLKKNIIVTQPTIVTTSDIPYQIVQNYKNLSIGENIGFQTGTLVRKPVKGVLFATVGILLQHLKLLTDEEFMKKYSYILLDEIHNRSIEMDTTMFYLKNLIERNYENPACPFLILTSGTFEPEIFMDYFKCPADAFLDVVGSSHPIQDNFAAFDVTDYIDYSVDLVEKIHLENLDDIKEKKAYRDIAIFVQGGAQIKKISEKIHLLNATVFSKGVQESKKHMNQQQAKWTKKGGASKPKDEEYYLVPIMLMSENIQKGEKDYQDLFTDTENISINIYEFEDAGGMTGKVLKTVPASRKVIIATNSAETGITIEGLKYCIDTGMVNESQFNPNFGCNILMNKNVTQASSRQRRGRVGRKDPGLFYTCYTKEVYDKMPPLSYPDIVKADVTNFVLDVILTETKTTLEKVDSDKVTDKSFQMNKFDQWWYELQSVKQFDSKKLDFIQYPAADSVSYAIEKLYGLGFIDHEYKPTLFGYLASKFRKVNIENIRMILGGYQHGANILDLITITCFLQAGHKLGIKKNKYIPRNVLGLSAEEAEKYFTLIFADEFVEYLFIWNDFMEEVETINKSLKKQKSSSYKQIREALPKWAEQNGFNYDVLVKIISSRDEMIVDLLNIGLNPFYNGLELTRGTYNLVNILRKDLTEGLEEIRKIKKSIYEGYRFNLLKYDEEAKAYIAKYGHNKVNLSSKLLKPIKLDDDIQQSRPRFIIVSSVMLQSSSNNPGMYEFNGGDISVLDGFVDVDEEFINR
jgi:HrpA-like RNA helicase